MDKTADGARHVGFGRELLVLGIVRRRPLSAYAIDRAVRSHTALYRGLGQGNTYNFVGRLAKAGYLASRPGKTSRGPAESKLVYRLTRKGEERFHDVLQAVVYDSEASDSAFEIALVLLGQLPRPEASRMLVKRDKELAAQERRLKRLFGNSETRSGPANLASSHAVYRLQGEQRFVRDMLRLVVNPRWHPDWT